MKQYKACICYQQWNWPSELELGTAHVLNADDSEHYSILLYSNEHYAGMIVQKLWVPDPQNSPRIFPIIFGNPVINANSLKRCFRHETQAGFMQLTWQKSSLSEKKKDYNIINVKLGTKMNIFLNDIMHLS